MRDDQKSDQWSVILEQNPELAKATRNLRRAFLADISEEERLDVVKHLSPQERLHGLDSAAREEMLALLLGK